MDSTALLSAPESADHKGMHRPFLEWAARDEGEDRGVGLGAFLVMRLVDRFGADAISPGNDALTYQCFSTRSFIADIRPQTEISSLLYEVTRVAEAALESQNRRMLFPPLMALAHNLEEDYRFNEALDVLDTAMRLSDGRDAEEELGISLQRARLLRNSGAFSDARRSYERAGVVAARLGDKHSELLSRIGRGIVDRQTGNLPESEKVLRGVIAEAGELHDTDAEARASQDLACTLYFAGRVAEAAPLAFHAYELYDNPADNVRALSDTGVMLKALGHYNAAQNAFTLVLSHELRTDVRARAEIECLEVAALIGDRVAFERWRQAIAQDYNQLPKDVQLDYELQLGIGFAMFDEFARAEVHARRAVSLAEELRMGERVFAAERQLAEIRDRRSKWREHTVPPAEETKLASPVSGTIKRLENLVAIGRD